MKNNQPASKVGLLNGLPNHQVNWIREVEEYILNDLNNSRLVVADLAKAFSLSERQFHRRVKQIQGITPNLFIRNIRMQAAKEMLEQGKCATVAETAFAVGYNQPDYFSRLFTKCYGCRPIDYIRGRNRNSIQNRHGE